jgi:hypothetical protein
MTEKLKFIQQDPDPVPYQSDHSDPNPYEKNGLSTLSATVADSDQWMDCVSSHVQTNRLLVWDTLDFAAIRTTYMTKEEAMTKTTGIKKSVDKTRGRLLQQDGQSNTIAYTVLTKKWFIKHRYK